jgi:FkbM family methyltransferase
MKQHLITRSARYARRKLKKAWRKFCYRNEGLEYASPNYLFNPSLLGTAPVVIDTGCGYEAEFSLFMIANKNARAFAIDPTRKHAPQLEALTVKHPDAFTYFQMALAGRNGTITFHEPVHFESGSIEVDHGNISRDDTNVYQVEAVTPGELMSRLGLHQADMLKLDIEGAEYNLLENVGREELIRFRQLFIEFHHHTIASRTPAHTLALVDKIRGFGFSSYSLDDHNFLMVRQF